MRFASAGEDARGNTYYLLSPCNHSGFPSSSTLGMTDDYPLSWTILVHGTPYALSPVTSAHDDPDNKSNGVNGEAKAKTMTKTSAAAAAAAAAPVSVEERELARAKRGDAWFLVDPLKEGDLLIEWIEFGAKFVMYDRKKAAYDRAKEGKPELTGVEAEPSKKEDQSDLIHAIRVYVEYVKAAKELAKAEVKEKGKGRVAAQKVKDGAGYGEGDEDDEEDQDDMLDENAMHDEEDEEDEEDELDSD